MNIASHSYVLHAGTPLAQARSAVVLLHGRGSSGDDIIRLADAFADEGVAFLSPSAATGAWYPQRFFVPLAHNEPALSRSLGVVDEVLQQIVAAGLPPDRVGLVGFSQGGCLALEYATRHPQRYGFVAGLSSALIGPLELARPATDLRGTPVLLGCAEEDAHIPLEFVDHSAATLAGFKAIVTKRIFPGAAHTVFPEEILWLQQHLAALPAAK